MVLSVDRRFVGFGRRDEDGDRRYLDVKLIGQSCSRASVCTYLPSLSLFIREPPHLFLHLRRGL